VGCTTISSSFQRGQRTYFSIDERIALLRAKVLIHAEVEDPNDFVRFGKSSRARILAVDECEGDEIEESTKHSKWGERKVRWIQIDRFFSSTESSVRVLTSENMLISCRMQFL
jgi:hypothetical protein